jgi:uncharacterized ion transporter superfamily protein YfcC
MNEKAGAQISKKAFLQSFFILLALMLLAGILTRVIPAGTYQRMEIEGRMVLDPNSYQPVERPAYPIWRWFTAPFEVLAGPDALILITILVFILLVSASFAILDKTGILAAALFGIVHSFGKHKYILLPVITLFFMVMGAFFGLFEEILPLVPLLIALSYSLGWDALVGLGMSIFAANMGFSAAITNPFTIGVAQRLADLPLFSGAAFRFPIFLTIYLALTFFLLRYARRIEQNPQASLLWGEDFAERNKYNTAPHLSNPIFPKHLRPASIWFLIFVVLILCVLFSTSFIPNLSDYSLPVVGILFFIGGLGAGLLSQPKRGTIAQALLEGLSGIAPGIPLILMAAAIQFIMRSGSVMDTILHSAASLFQSTGPFSAAYLIFGLALLLEFFIGSAGAKAILMMPILLPLADLVGITRQVTVLAYCFGDGFSNLAYPTNPVLLIALGLAGVRYGRWMRWSASLWFVVLGITAFFLWLGVKIQYGPF